MESKFDKYEREIVFDIINDLTFMKNNIIFYDICNELLDELVYKAHGVKELSIFYDKYVIVQRLYDKVVDAYES